MGKKSAKVSLIYLIGMAIVAVGCFFPLAKAGRLLTVEGNSVFNLIIGKDTSTVIRISTILILAGAILGVIFSLLKGSNSATLRLVGLIASVAGVLIELINKLTSSNAAKHIGKGAVKLFNVTPYLGFYIIAAGLIIAIIGFVTKK